VVEDTAVNEVVSMMALFDDIVEVVNVVRALVVLLVVIGERFELSDSEEEAVLSIVDDSSQLVEDPLATQGVVGVEVEGVREEGETEDAVPGKEDELVLRRDDEVEKVVPGREIEVLLPSDDDSEVIGVGLVLAVSSD
jgi:hypothetical protein